jgi:hypothetical protein
MHEELPDGAVEFCLGARSPMQTLLGSSSWSVDPDDQFAAGAPTIDPVVCAGRVRHREHLRDMRTKVSGGHVFGQPGKASRIRMQKVEAELLVPPGEGVIERPTGTGGDLPARTYELGELRLTGPADGIDCSIYAVGVDLSYFGLEIVGFVVHHVCCSELPEEVVVGCTADGGDSCSCGGAELGEVSDAPGSAAESAWLESPYCHAGVHVGVAHPDQHSVGADGWDLEISHLQDFQTAERVVSDSTQGRHTAW